MIISFNGNGRLPRSSVPLAHFQQARVRDGLWPRILIQTGSSVAPVARMKSS